MGFDLFLIKLHNGEPAGIMAQTPQARECSGLRKEARNERRRDRSPRT